MIVLLMGLPGSGKTWLATQLQEHIDCVILNRDVVRDSVFPEQTLDYSSEQNELASRITNQVADYILKRNPHYLLLLDGRPFSKKYQVEEIQELARRVGHELKGIFCWAPDEVIQQRLEEDLLEEPENRVANRDMDKYLRIKEDFDEIEIDHIRINTDDPFPQNLTQILEYLGVQVNLD